MVLKKLLAIIIGFIRSLRNKRRFYKEGEKMISKVTPHGSQLPSLSVAARCRCIFVLRWRCCAVRASEQGQCHVWDMGYGTWDGSPSRFIFGTGDGSPSRFILTKPDAYRYSGIGVI